ncbi:unnamed protein product [Peniophora sp. CBMAI 1063]|nr:unnamed protein product [Peniophora sp. CBMAI 1063]
MKPAGVSLVLTRSQPLPLELRVQSKSVAASRLWLSPEVLQRTKRLLIGTTGELATRDWQIIAPLLETDIPLLEDLAIVLEPNSEGAFLSDKICANTCKPNISRLTLSNCVIHPSSQLFSYHMTYLFLRVAHTHASAAYTSDLRPVLAGMRNLQELHLINIAPCIMEHGSFVLNLPEGFRELLIVLNRGEDVVSAGMILFLSGLSLPPHATAFYEFDQFLPLNEDDIRRSMPGLFSGLDWERVPQELYICISFVSLRPLAEYAQVDELQVQDPEPHFLRRALHWSMFFDYSSPVTVLRGAFPCDKLQALHFDEDELGRFLKKEPLDTYRAFSHVQRITIESLVDDFDAFFSTLSSPRFIEAEAPQFVFPLLRVLVFLRTVDTSNAKKVNEEKQAIDKSMVLIEAGLTNMVQQRAAAGHPIEEMLVDQAYSPWAVWASMTGVRVHFIDSFTA